MTTPIDIILQGTDQASSTINGVGDALGGLGGLAGGVLTAGLATAAAGLTALGAGAALSVSEALSAQNAQASLAQVIKSTGGAAGLTQDAANKLAMQFRDLAGGSDEAVLAIEEIGLRAGTISADQMPKFIQTTLDLGEVMGSTEAAATLLARAQEDPIAAMSKAQRAGIVFSESLKEQIKQLVKNGDTAGATALLMDRLGEATGGAAQASADTLSGKWEVMQGHLMEAAETVGNSLLPILQTLFDTAIAPAIPIVEGLAASIGTLVGQVASGDFSGLQNMIPPELLAQLEPLQAAFTNLFSAIQTQMPAALAQGQAFTAWLQEALGTAGPVILSNMAAAVNALAEIWREHGDTIMTVVRYAFEIAVATIGGAIELISGIVTAGMQLMSGNWQGAFDAMQQTLIGFFDLAAGIVGSNWATFSAQWKANWDMLQIIIGKVLMDITAGFQTWIINTINTLKGYYETFREIGIGLMNNVLLGIQQMVAQIINAVVGMVTSAIGAAGKALGEANPFGGGTTGGSTIPGRASGGLVTGGAPYIVGESGPELFVPGSNGAIVPNGQLGGGNGDMTITINVDGAVLYSIVQREARAQGALTVQVN